MFIQTKSMKKHLLFVWYLATTTLLAGTSCQRETDTINKDYTQYVDPWIGTAHCRWFHFTPGALPFGMAKPAPSTSGHLGNRSGWEAVGYDYRDTSIEGFPNFHEFQIGGVVLMPTNGTLKTVPGEAADPDEGYRSRFSRENETARCGYYSVLLSDYGIRVELTATKRVAFHRYTYPASDRSRILFDIGNRQGESGAVKDAAVCLTPEGRVEGFVETEPEYVKTYQRGGSVKMYFSAVLDKKPSGWGTFRGTSIQAGAAQCKGPGAGLWIEFPTQEGEQVNVRIGLSYTSIENARNNFQAEAENLDFDRAAQTAHDTWNDCLGRIDVEGKNHDDLVKFYTGLYHATLGRGLCSDVNGAYPRNDGSVGQIELRDGRPLHAHYNTDAMWGGFWNLSQLWTLAYPEYLSDFIKSQLLVYRDAGWLGDGIACSRFVSGVGTNYIGLLIAAAYNCGIRDFDVDLGYEAARKNELEWKDRPAGAGKADVRAFIERGYIPYPGDTAHWTTHFTASHTLEYSFSAYAVAQMARDLGHEEDYEKLMWLSHGWERLYDSLSGLIVPRGLDGQFIANFNPTQSSRGFQEGNAYQYTFYVPHDAPKLIEKMGVHEFERRLDSIFTLSRRSVFGGGKKIDAFAGLEAPYNHGNQPCLHIPWLFNYTTKPWLTQKWVRTILDEFYGTEGIHGYGYGQDEDQGQLGAWYVISAMGLFDVKGLSGPDPTLGIGSPLFDRIRIRLDSRYYPGKTLEIRTANGSEENCYVQKASFEGRPLPTPFIPFSDLTAGGTLLLEMGPEPPENH